MAILTKALSSVAVLMAAFLFAAARDVGHLGLGDMLGVLMLVPVLLFVVCSIVPQFLGGGSAGAEELDEEGLTAKINEVQSKAASSIVALQATVDRLAGQDNEAVMAENKALREELEAIHQAERDRVASQAEELRLKNEELENQIKQWAIQTVADTVKADDAGQARAA